MSNAILHDFLTSIKKAQGDDGMLDVSDIMNDKQFLQFKKLEEIIQNLFGAKTLFDGLEKTVDGDALTDDLQISVIAILKIFETFIASMSKAQTSMNNMMEMTESNSSIDELGADGMYT